MKTWFDRLVRERIARHLKRPTAAVTATDRLGTDLDLLPLDLVLISLELEDVTRTRLPVERLAAARTVSDLATLLSDVSRGTDLAALERRFRPRRLRPRLLRIDRPSRLGATRC